MLENLHILIRLTGIDVDKKFFSEKESQYK